MKSQTILNMMDIKELAYMVYKDFDKKSKGIGIKNETKKNRELANELHKPIIRKFRKRKVYSSFRDNIWGIDLDIFYVLLIYFLNMLLLFH